MKSLPSPPRGRFAIDLLGLLCLVGMAAGCGRTGLLGTGSGGGDGDGGSCMAGQCPDLIVFTIDGGPRRDGGIDGGPHSDGGGDMSDCHSRPEVCNNHLDDNCDGLVDCMDPECLGAPGCLPPGSEICNNGLDDDKNGLIDCADPACASFPGCQMPHLCDPNHPDCADPACVDDPACQNLVCKPSVDFGALAHNDARSERAFSTSGTVDVAKSTCAPAGGGQVVTTFEVTSDQTVVNLEFSQMPGADHAFGLYRSGVDQSCTANPVECYDPQAAPNGNHAFVLDHGHYYLLALAFTKQHQGNLDVVLTTPSAKHPEICNNGLDDNGDGLIDCADPQCFNDPACAAHVCKPDVNLGTIIPGQRKTASIDTTGGNATLHIQCGGTGLARTIQFSLAETVWLENIFHQFGGDHVTGLYRLPPDGTPCDANMLECTDLQGNMTSNWVWDFALGAGDYVLIVQALKPGTESPVDVDFDASRPNKLELCHNGIDDDLNGLIDCADPACFDDHNCPPPVCSPDVDFGTLTVDGPAMMATLDLKNGVPHENVTCAKGGGRSRVVQFKFDDFAGLSMNCSQNGGRAVIDLFSEAAPRASCDQNELACGDPAVIPFGCGWEWPGLQPGIYYVIVQAFQSGDEGLIDLTLSAVHDRALEICNNGIDDDMDGFTDCLDPKCALSPVCLKKACKADATIDPMPIGGKMVVESLDTRNHQANTLPACAAAPNGGNVVVMVNLPQDATLDIAFSQPFGNNDHVIAVYADANAGLPCDASPAISCQPTQGMASGSLAFANLKAGKYWVVVAANKPGTEGPIDLSFTAMP